MTAVGRECATTDRRRNGDLSPAPAPLSLPRWPHIPAPPDPTAVAYLVIGVGASGSRLSLEYAAALSVPATVRTMTRLDDDLDQIIADVSRMLVGHRVCAIGPETELLRLAAIFDTAGLLESEFSMCATSTDELTVYCVHCSATTVATATPEDVVCCSGCRRHLYIDPHVSRRKAGYLGTDAYAQELR